MWVDLLRWVFGGLLYLLYLISAANPELTDFDMDSIRKFIFKEDSVEFEEDERDWWMRKRLEEDGKPAEQAPVARGQRMSSGEVWDELFGVEKGRGTFLRLKYR